VAQLSAQAPNIQGAAMTYSAVSSSDTCVPGNNVYLHVKTVGTGATVTVVVPGTLYGETLADVDVTLSTNVDRHIGPLVAGLADPSTGLVTITYSTTTAVTAALLQFG
jgi:hypothetical protein